MSTVCCPSVVVPTQRPMWQRGWDDLSAWLLGGVARLRQTLGQQARRQARHRTLQGLSDATLRDIGMADGLPPRQPSLTLLDYERGRLF